MQQDINLYATLDKIANGIITINKSGEITFMNSAAEKLLEEHSALGRDFNEIVSVVNANPENRGGIKTQSTRHIFPAMEDGIELILRNKNDKYIYGSISSIYNNEGDTDGHLIILKSVPRTENLKNDIEFNMQMKVMEQFASRLAHDFNNQLAGIQNNIEVIKYKKSNPPETEEYIANIESCINNSKEIIKQLLIYTNKKKLQKRYNNINTIIESALKIVNQDKDNRIKIVTGYNAFNSIVYCDFDLMQNAILNIITNADEAAGDKAGIITVVTDITSKKTNEGFKRDFISITVKDNGKGIPEKEITNVYKPLYTTKKNSMGLGLSIAKSIINKHNGEIQIESTPGTGTNVNIVIPVSESRDGEQIKNYTSPVNMANKIDASILILDDEEKLQNTIKILLAQLGVRVHMFSGSKYAIDFYKENYNKVDLAIIDLMMPEQNGKDVLQKMKKINPDVKALVQSGYFTELEKEECIKIGFQGFIEKPYSKDELFNKICSII